MDLATAFSAIVPCLRPLRNCSRFPKQISSSITLAGLISTCLRVGPFVSFRFLRPGFAVRAHSGNTCSIFDAAVVQGKVIATWTYSLRHHRRKTIEHLVGTFASALRETIEPTAGLRDRATRSSSSATVARWTAGAPLLPGTTAAEIYQGDARTTDDATAGKWQGARAVCLPDRGSAAV